MGWSSYDFVRNIDTESLDSKVQKLKQNGKGVNEISRRLCVPMSVVRWSLTTETKS